MSNTSPRTASDNKTGPTAPPATDTHARTALTQRSAESGHPGATWSARLAVAAVFIVNLQCALGFIIDPSSYAAAFEQHGAAGLVAMQGLGVAFLMWNTTYPLVILNPARHRTLFAIVVVQQAIGLLGETLIATRLPAGHEALAESIGRFISFDAFGLVLMSCTFVLLCASQHRKRANDGK